MSEVFNRLKSLNNPYVELFLLSIPLIIGNLGQILIGATDVFVAARHNINTLASISIANSILFSISIIGIGLMASISILLANYRGERKPTKKFFITSINFSILLSVLTSIACLLSMHFIDRMGFEPNLVPAIKEYMFICSFSFLGMYIFQSIKEFLQAHEIVNFPNIVMLWALVIHLVLAFMLVFGFGPIPSLGAKGLAISTLIVRTIMGLILSLYCFKLFKIKTIFHFNYVKQLIKIGYPIGFSLLLEFLGFNIITMLVGRISGVLSATHSIVLTIVSTTFMIPLAISNAISIKIGYFNGAKNFKQIKKYSLAGIVMVVSFMSLCSLLLYKFPTGIIKIFTDNPQIIKTGLPIMFVAALFQIFDGFQVALGGVLKGLKMTKIVSVCVISAYWFLGIPLGFILAYHYNLLLLGFWIGLAISLFSLCPIETIIMLKQFKNLKSRYTN